MKKLAQLLLVFVALFLYVSCDLNVNEIEEIEKEPKDLLTESIWITSLGDGGRDGFYFKNDVIIIFEILGATKYYDTVQVSNITNKAFTVSSWTWGQGPVVISYLLSENLQLSYYIDNRHPSERIGRCPDEECTQYETWHFCITCER